MIKGSGNIFEYKLNENKVNFSNILESVLKNRGINEIREFLNPNESHVESMKLYDNVDIAVEKIFNHLKDDSKISIVVDEDADGYTSFATIYQYLCDLKINFHSKSKITYLIHSSKKHGLTDEMMIKIEQENPKLVIIPDASSNDYEQHFQLHKKNIDIIVLDHHEAEKYSEYAIVINNQLSDRVTNKTLTGVGIVYKFCKHIDEKLSLNFADKYLDLVSVGMIADSCDLRNLESRFFVLKGIEQLEKGKNYNKLISALIQKRSYSMKNKVTILGIGFYINPLINSIIRCGTIEEKKLLLEAFINSDRTLKDKIRGKGEVELSVQEYVVRLAEKCKRKQDKSVNDSLNELTLQIDKFNLYDNGIVVVNGTGIVENNLTGLVANKIASSYQKPCLVLRSNNDEVSGSGRGFEKSGINDFKEWCNTTKLFEFARGHSNAFGVKINNKNINDLYKVISEIKTSDKLIYHVDGEFNEQTLTKYIINSVAEYDYIWGNSVDEPLFVIKDIKINKDDISLLGANKNTLKFKFKEIDIIKFKSSEDEYNELKCNDTISLTAIVKFNINDYNGNKYPQIKIEDMIYEKANATFRF